MDCCWYLESSFPFIEGVESNAVVGIAFEDAGVDVPAMEISPLAVLAAAKGCDASTSVSCFAVDFGF